MLLEPTDDPGNDILLGSLLTDFAPEELVAILLAPTDDPGNDILLGSMDSLFTDGGSLFMEEDEMLPPYRGGVGAFECMDTRLESSDIARDEGLSRW